ncbi:aldo/keto reductase [Lichenicoccus roseus]|uniref:aldo/keto reductase n=1 Tax=Lichenicoccus roseus TaxID=2683649 RepID=UPI001F0E12B3|nr:aldo/keto reductase [Lichenicoccus roseus]
MIPTRSLGRSGLAVSRLGFGANAIGNLYVALDENDARDAVDAAWDSGVRYYDTAPLYGHGLSERRLGDRLRVRPRDDYVLSSKVGRLLRPHGRTTPHRLSVAEGGIFEGELPFRPEFDFSYDATMRSFEDSLQRLGLARIDILLIHDADEWTHGDAIGDRLREVETGALRALRRLRDEGAISAFGAGVNQATACERLMDLGEFDCFLLAGRYTLLEQDALDGLLPRCMAQGVSIILGAPFNSGILATGAIPGARYNYQPADTTILERVARIEAVCGAHDVPLAAAALQFVLAHPAVASVIPGARSAAEARRNAELVATRIPVALWDDLRAERLLRPDAPSPATVQAGASLK